MRRARWWIGALWIWWSVCAVLLTSLWGQTLTSQSLSVLNARDAAMTINLRTLSQAFTQLQKLQSELVDALAVDAHRQQLSRKRVDDVRAQAEPFAHIYCIDVLGRPALADDRASIPPHWLVALAIPRLRAASMADDTVLRPEPPAMEVGRLTAAETAIPDDAPPSYLLICARLRDHQYAIAQLNLDYVFGPWLRERVADFGFGADAVAARVDADPTAPPLRPFAPPPLGDPSLWTAWPAIRAARSWTWRVPTLFADDAAHPFDMLDLKLDNGPALDAVMRRHIVALLLGTVLMLSFAVSLWLAGLGVRREIEFAQARERFTALVSHELRTPVAAIAMYAEILENKLVDDAEKIAAYHHVIGEEAGRLARLIENLLEVGRIERGARTFQLAPTNLNDVVREAVSARWVEAPVDADVVLELDETLPPARADGEAMRMVVSNLVQNACKYGGAPARVTVATHAANGAAAVDVMDRGPGVPADERARIFEPYRRLASEPRGVGLGLALVKGFVEGQGGTVSVSDRPGGGAIFRVTLPFQSEGET